jgi:hypothetical protein
MRLHAFRGNYHIGLGALLNSLFRNGFRGTLFAGYRGALPPWANSASTKDGIADFAAADGCHIRFVSLDTPLHLASYKPIFMRRVFEHANSGNTPAAPYRSTRRAPCAGAGSRWQSAMPSDVSIADPEDFWTIA